MCSLASFGHAVAPQCSLPAATAAEAASSHQHRHQPSPTRQQTTPDSGRQGRTAKNSGCRSSSLRCKTGLLTTNCLACPTTTLPPLSIPFRVPVADAVSVAVAGNFWAEKTSRDLALSAPLACAASAGRG